jgi:alpha-beta hydrolase superfamily lysophospholipase
MPQTNLRKRRQFGWRRWTAILVLGAVIALNLVAFMQVWTMTHYSPGGIRTVKPEELSLIDKTRVVLLGAIVPRPVNSLTPAALGLPYETRVITLTAGDDLLEAWYVGPPNGTHGIVLMFPGYATSKDVLLAQAGEFYRLGWTPLLVDFRGAGGSTGSDTTLGAREDRDVVAALDYVHQEWPGAKVVLYGVSMGAAAILRAYAQEGARPDALILESPFDSLLNTVRNRFDAMSLPAFPSAELMVFWGGVQHGFDGFAHNPADYASSVRCPTLLMYGESDPRVTAGQSLAIYDHLNPEGGKVRVAFAGARHESLIASDRDKWVQSVDRFLREILSPR